MNGSINPEFNTDLWNQSLTQGLLIQYVTDSLIRLNGLLIRLNELLIRLNGLAEEKMFFFFFYNVPLGDP